MAARGPPKPGRGSRRLPRGRRALSSTVGSGQTARIDAVDRERAVPIDRGERVRMRGDRLVEDLARTGGRAEIPSDDVRDPLPRELVEHAVAPSIDERHGLD